MATAMKQPKGIPDSLVTGGIDPNKAYALNEFLKVAAISRQSLSDLRKLGLVVRDTGSGTPTMLGSDWIEFVKTRPAHVPKPRGRHNLKNASVGTTQPNP
jgi:hypothetical protein